MDDKGIECPYCNDCFKCPLGDCKIGQIKSIRVNKLEIDNLYNYGFSKKDEKEW